MRRFHRDTLEVLNPDRRDPEHIGIGQDLVKILWILLHQRHQMGPFRSREIIFESTYPAEQVNPVVCPFIDDPEENHLHDIGKNIVSVVLACNSYAITDLGVMTPAERIVAAAKETDTQLIGLSGLITPSLDEMIHTVEALAAAGICVPVCVGGATTSKLHTALKIAPRYKGPVIWTKDASQMVLVAAKVLNPATREAFIRETNEEYARLRSEAAKSSTSLRSLEKARENRLRLFD